MLEVVKLAKSRLRSYSWLIVVLFCTMLWGSASPAIKLGYDVFRIDTSNTFNILIFAGVRMFGGGWMTLLLSRVITGKNPRFYPALIRPTITVALIQTVMQYLFFYLGLTVVSGASGSLLSSTSVFFAVILAAAVGYERFTGRKFTGIILGLLGIIILNLGSGLELAFRWNGELFILLSALANGLANLAIKRFGQSHEPISLTGFQFILGGAILTIIGLLGGGRLIWPGFLNSLVLVYLMLVSALAYGLWSLLLKRHEVSKIVIFHSVTPVFGALFSWIALGENIWRWQTLVAMIVIALGIGIINYRKPEHKVPAEVTASTRF